MERNILNIPIYLDQKIVFDMIAIIEDGFSQFVSVEISNESNIENNGEVKTGLGLNNKLSFLNVKLDGNINAKEGQNEKTHQTIQKTHTPTSLFQKLWNYLDENKMIKNINKIENFKVGDFVEFKGTLSRNPVISTVDSFKQMIELMSAITSEPKEDMKKNKNHKNNNNSEILKQLNALSNGLQSGGKIDLICTLEEDSEINEVVIPVDLEFFGENGVAEVADGQYKIIGKVVKFVDEDNSINLLRNTSFSKIKTKLLKELFNAFNTPEMDSAGIERTEMITCINGPSIMIIPIAIYI